MKKITLAILFLSLIATAAVGCADLAAPASAEHELYPQLKPIYDRLGGARRLGAPIAGAFNHSTGTVRQYIQNAVLEYNSVTGTSAIVPVGLELKINPNAEEVEIGKEAKQINGVPVPDEIAELVGSMGFEYVGSPLTKFQHNPSHKRYEIYFEKLGFWIGENDETKTVNLLPYGNWGMAIYGPLPEPVLGRIDSTGQNEIIQLDKLAEKIGAEFSGSLLLEIGSDTGAEPLRIYENIAMGIDPNSRKAVLLDLPALLGIQPSAPNEKKMDERYLFFPVIGKLGYNIPTIFYEMIIQHGGLDVSGQPINEIYYTDDSHQVIQQCFENLCLNFNLATETCQPAKLGQEYHARNHNQSQPVQEPILVISMKIWDAHETLAPGQVQEIHAFVSQNNEPIQGISPSIEITMPDRQIIVLDMPPTNDEGLTFVRIPPISGGHGEFVTYQVCIPGITTSRFCIPDGFLIWELK